MKKAELQRFKSIFLEKIATLYFDIDSLEIEYWRSELELVLLLDGAIKYRTYKTEESFEQQIIDTLIIFNNNEQVRLDFENKLEELFDATTYS
jgi:hypothetical protein